VNFSKLANKLLEMNID